jgi:hypothetical protein
MKTLIALVLALLLPSLALAQTKADSVSQVQSAADSARRLEQLLAEVRAVIPNNWKAEIGPGTAGKEKVRVQGDKPYIVLWRTEEAKTYYAGPGGPSRVPRGEPKTELKEVLFTFWCMPYMSKQEYQKAKEENVSKHLLRRDAEQKLRGLEGSSMGNPPLPPMAYKPRNEAESKLVRQYAFVWLNTEPRSLPEYYYHELSFTADTMEWYRFPEPDVMKEIEGVRGKLLKILGVYAPNPIPNP